MSSSFTGRQTSGSAKRSNPPVDAEFSTLFSLLPSPALLLDNSRGLILQANSAFLQLTTFASNELVGRELRSLISGLPEHALAGETMFSVILERRSRPAMPVNMHTRALGSSAQRMVIIIEPQEDKRANLMNRVEQLIKNLSELNRLPDDVSYRQSIERGLQIVCEQLDLTGAALYRIDGEQVWKTAEAGESGLLPEIIPPNDLMRLSQTFVWRPGRRVQTELHRSARIANLTFLATTPTSQSSLLVLADRFQEPSEHLTKVTRAVGEQFSGLMNHLARVIELRKQTLENRRELSVWRSIGENAQEGILLLAPDMTVNEMNPAAEWMLGYADWEVKGQPVENILIGPERLLPALETAYQGIPTHNMGNVSLHRRTGQAFPAHIQIVPVQREGETLAMVIFFRDVSEHEEIRNRTQQLEQRAVLGEVTAVFAHEVRNPINNISTGLQLLSVLLPENDPNQENISRLLVDCTRLNHLMESVLNFSRRSEHRVEEVNIETLLRRLLDRWRPRFAKVNVTPFFQIEEGTPNVLADPRSIEQVFTNLVSNAVEAMGSVLNENGSPAGGTLAIRVASFREGTGRPQVEISVSDTGPGIPDEVRERIFEPFVTTKTQGTGLGLAITKRIVTAHHGSLNLNSFPGGTVFHVILSAYQGESA